MKTQSLAIITRREEANARMARANRNVMRSIAELLRNNPSPEDIADAAEALEFEADNFNDEYAQAMERVRELRRMGK